MNFNILKNLVNFINMNESITKKISLKFLQDHFEKHEITEEIKNIVPLQSNYLIEWPTPNRGNIIERYRDFVTSKTSIENHLKISNADKYCGIVLKNTDVDLISKCLLRPKYLMQNRNQTKKSQ